jgi:hypothetical protein
MESFFSFKGRKHYIILCIAMGTIKPPQKLETTSKLHKEVVTAVSQSS